MILKNFRKILSSALILCASVTMFAQNHTVSGVVKDAIGPVIGATVMVENSTIGVSTDLDGKYTLNNVSPSAKLVFSCIGYNSQTIEVGNKSVIDVTLTEDITMIEETVVVGYGVQKKSDVTGAISQVKSEDMEHRTLTSADQALQGKTAGVVAMMGSAAPGSSPTIRVRGFSSNGSSDPLYIVDGLRVSSTDISGIDPNSIKSMEVLKDASSAAIYGAQAGNGVVLITTKSGDSGSKGKISYEFQQSFQTLAYVPEVLNADEYITYYKEKDDAAHSFQRALDNFYDGVTDTDWIEEGFETSHMQKHSLQFNGGSNTGSYFLSMSYTNDNGIVIGDKDTFNRFAVTLNANHKFNDWVKVTSNMSMDRSVSNNSVVEGTRAGGYVSSLFMLDPLTPVRVTTPTSTMQSFLDAGLTLLGDEQGYYATSEFFSSQQANPYVLLASKDNLNRRFQVRGNLSLDLTPFKGFTFTSRLGYRFNGMFNNTFVPKYTFNTMRYSDYNKVTSQTSIMQYYQWENFANYNFNIGKNAFTAMAGMSFDETVKSNTYGSVDAIMKEDELYHYLDYKASTANQTTTGDDLTSHLLSYFGRLNWDYDGKYQAQVSLRADAADLSILSPKARWGYFPAASAGWVISKEPFFQAIDQDILNYVKFRASWGQNGSISGLSNYMWSSVIESNGFANLVDGTSTDKYTTGMRPSYLGNEDLTWETSEQTDFGLDFRFFNSKLAITTDYYVKKTKDLIVTGATPSLSVGNTSSPINGGSVLNKGFEFEATWKDHIGDFNYTVSGNIATLHNEVTYVSDYVSGKLPGASFMNYTELTMFQAGYPVWYYNGWTCTGIDETTGYPQFKDLNDDGQITDADKSYIGDAIPDFTYGITLSGNYKNFDFVVFGTGSQGNQIYQWLSRSDNAGGNILKMYYDDRWTPENTSGKFPSSLTNANDMAHYYYSSAMVKDGSFFKIKQIQFGYTLPERITKKIAISNLRVYASLEDFFTFTNYDGLDPEASSANLDVKSAGIDSGSYPSSRKMTFGVNLTF